MLHKMKTKFVGDRAFYAMILAIAVPIMIQNGITNFVNLLDNIMVGQVGTGPMSGVAIVNQLIFVFNLCIFGGFSGAGIFGAQYFGIKDYEGVRYTLRYKLWIGFIIIVGAVCLFLGFGDKLIGLYLNGSSSELELALTHGLRYLHVMLLGLPAFMLGQAYAGALRECGETVVPMKAGVSAVFVNLVLNYILIYGKFGLPALGVVGAAIATVISRYLECLIVIIWTHAHKDKYPYVEGLYKTLRIPGHVVKKIFIKGAPLLVNETLWACGMAMLTQCYSMRGLDTVAAQNIANTINNVFNIGFMAMGDAVAIIVGQLLGAGKMEEAVDTDNKIIAFSVVASMGVACFMMLIAPFFPRFYNTTEAVRSLAMKFILLQALFMPQYAFLHATYFTLRSGGKTFVTFLFDSVYITLLTVPVAFCLSRFTALHVLLIFVIVQMTDWIKCGIGFILVKKGIWINNIVTD